MPPVDSFFSLADGTRRGGVDPPDKQPFCDRWGAEVKQRCNTPCWRKISAGATEQQSHLVGGMDFYRFHSCFLRGHSLFPG